MKYFTILLLVLSGCATSNYKQGCLDGLDEAFIGPYTDWQEKLCERLDQARIQKLEEQKARNAQYGRGR